MDRPTASPPYFPYREHRNMAEVAVLQADRRAYTDTFGPAMARACPRCGAAPGKRCILPGGGPYESIHNARRRL